MAKTYISILTACGAIAVISNTVLAQEATYSTSVSELQFNISTPVAGEAQHYLLEQSVSQNLVSETVEQQPQQLEIPPPDKSQYNLFNPTPEALMRELSTDRPDQTESPFTVDAGHFQVEADLFVYTKDTDGTHTESLNLLVPNLKVGLLNNVDLQIIPEVYNVVRTTPENGSTEERSGFGDITVRVKVNFWGNDSGKTAFAMMPFIKFPTNKNNLGNNSIEGGIIFPLAIELSDKWDLGMMTEFDFNKNEVNSGYNLGFVNSVTLGYAINSRLGTYFELFTEKTTEKGSDLIATFDTGLKYLLTENIQLDAGVNIGLTQAADDFQPFVGLSMRF
ncbi:transporter [Fortiea contorta]|uniref:transporter n=1 Tax=Fortiea contorta TaxID=1892405 RepID=UPI00034DFC63|nr:transporter [Fortiea contorta]